MESLSMLKHWKGGRGATVAPTDGGKKRACNSPLPVETVAVAVLRESDETDDEAGKEDDDGPFYDIEFGDYCSDADDGSLAGGKTPLSLADDLEKLAPLNLNGKAHFPTLFSKSSTKLHVLMLGFKKAAASPKKAQQQSNILSRDCSKKAATEKWRGEDDEKNSKDLLQRYLSKFKIKPLYGMVSKGHATKTRHSSQSVAVGGEAADIGVDVEPLSEMTKTATGMKIMSNRLGKSRSASAAVAAVRSPPRRRDDSLLQQLDGIQSAIAHCKRSFNADRASPEPPPLVSRSNSDPLEGRL